jgi:hypothetical protein
MVEWLNRSIAFEIKFAWQAYYDLAIQQFNFLTNQIFWQFFRANRIVFCAARQHFASRGEFLHRGQCKAANSENLFKSGKCIVQKNKCKLLQKVFAQTYLTRFF